MSTITKASDHVKPCNIEQSERHNRRDAEYIASLSPRTLYVRTELSYNNESYVVPDLKGVTLQQHYDAIKAMVKQKTGRAMQEKKVTVIGKNGKPKERNGSSPIRESVVNIKPDTTMSDLLKYTEKVHQRWGVRAIQIHIHKDEGHYENSDDPTTWKPNLHAHIIWDWMNHETGKSYKLGKKDMEELQDMAAGTLEMERGKRKSETGAEHLERNDYILQKQEREKIKNQSEIEKQKTEIEKMAKASIIDKLLHSGLSPAVRKAIEDTEEAHKEELRRATTAVDKNGYPYVWAGGSKKDQVLTWEELAKCREREKKEIELRAKADKETALDKAMADKEAAVAKAQSDTKAEYETKIAKMKEKHVSLIYKERYAVNENGQPIYWSGGSNDGQKVTKDERIKWLGDQLEESNETNDALCNRLKTLKDLIFATCSQNFKKLVQIIVDLWNAGIKKFTKDVKDFFQELMSCERTEAGRKVFVEDTFRFAKILVKTNPNIALDDKNLQPLQEDAFRIADGTWESYHKKFSAAVNAVVEMGNNSYQKHLNQEQTAAIESFLGLNNDERERLYDEIWYEAKFRVPSQWRKLTFDALKDVCAGRCSNQGYGRGIGI